MERPPFMSDTLDSFETKPVTAPEVFCIETLMLKLGFLVKRTDFEMEVHDRINLKEEDSKLPKWAMEDRIRKAVIDAAQNNFDEDIRPLLEKALDVSFDIIMDEPDLMGNTKMKGYRLHGITCKSVEELNIKI